MKTPEELTTLDEITELLERMDERQFRKAALFTALFLKQGMAFEDAVAITEAEFPNLHEANLNDRLSRPPR